MGILALYLNGGSGNLMVNNNNLYGNFFGIEANPGTNSTLTGNNAYGNSNGIYIGGTGINVTANTVYSNIPNGMHHCEYGGSTVTSNTIFANGIGVNGQVKTTLTGNNIYQNGSGISSIGVGAFSGSTLTGNKVYSNSVIGVQLIGASTVTLTSNAIYSNVGYRIYLATGTNNTLTSNAISSKSLLPGTYLNNVSSTTLSLGNINYNNGAYGVWLATSTTIVAINGKLGYDASGTSFPNAPAEIVLDSTTAASNLTLQNMQVNPSAGIRTVGFSQPGSWLASFKDNGTAGLVKIYGDYQVSGATLTVDYTPALYPGSGDGSTQKTLLLGPSAAGFNHGRSEIEIAQGGGFSAQGSGSNPTTITMLGSSTYYTFVDSGAFTVNYASFTFMDEAGIHLLNSGPFSIMNSTFDYPGSGQASTSTLFTLQNVTNSTITVYGVTYSSTSSNNPYTYNYIVIGSSAGLAWLQQAYSGTLVGAANTQDDATQQHIRWGAVGCSTVTSLTNGNWSSTNTWDGGFVPTSCNPVYVISGTTVTLDINNAVASTITITGQLSFKRSGDNELTQVGGNLYVNAGGTLDMGTQASPITLGTTAYLVLSSGTVAGQYGLIVNNGGNFLVYGATKQPWTWEKSPAQRRDRTSRSQRLALTGTSAIRLQSIAKP